jgi:hypothetical protein
VQPVVTYRCRCSLSPPLEIRGFQGFSRKPMKVCVSTRVCACCHFCSYAFTVVENNHLTGANRCFGWVRQVGDQIGPNLENNIKARVDRVPVPLSLYLFDPNNWKTGVQNPNSLKSCIGQSNNKEVIERTSTEGGATRTPTVGHTRDLQQYNRYKIMRATNEEYQLTWLSIEARLNDISDASAVTCGIDLPWLYTPALQAPLNPGLNVNFCGQCGLWNCSFLFLQEQE